MADNGKSLGSLRFNRFEIERLTIVLAISLAAHLIAFGGYELGREWHLFPSLRQLMAVKQLPQQKQVQEQPLEFAMVETPSTEAPKNAKYYGAQNSVAADQTHKNQNVAEINGIQTEVVKTETTPREDFNKLQPQAKPQPKQEPRPATEPGDLTLAAPQKPQPLMRPQKLSQVMPHSLPGLKMFQNGGARASLVPSLNVKASPFGAYDEQFIDAVTERWYDLLDSQQFALDRTGKVVVRFHLNYDGSISDMTVLQNSVGELLGTICEDAIHDPAPYAAWPEEMRHQIGQTYREITFTFFYY